MVSPSDIAIATSRTLSLAVKCRSMCGVCGMTSSVLPELPEVLAGVHHRGRLWNDTDRAIGFEDGQLDLLTDSTPCSRIAAGWSSVGCCGSDGPCGGEG